MPSFLAAKKMFPYQMGDMLLVANHSYSLQTVSDKRNTALLRMFRA